MDLASLEKAVTALEEYNHGAARGSLLALDEAAKTSLTQPSVREQLESRLAETLQGKLSPVAKEYVCRKLALFGSARSVQALAALLGDGPVGEAARTTLEALPCPEAGAVLRDSLPKLNGRCKAGVINSLGARRDLECVPALIDLLEDPDHEIAGAAAAALGETGGTQAAEALGRAQSKVPEPLRMKVADARLTCAERLWASGRKPEALAIYKALNNPEMPKPVQLGAKRGLLRVIQKD